METVIIIVLLSLSENRVKRIIILRKEQLES